MANKKNNVIKFKLNENDYIEFGRYRILYTEQGKKMINRQRLTYILSGIMIAVLFTVFKVDATFTKLAYVASAAIAIGGAILAERMLLRQQDRAIEADKNTEERLHPVENVVTFGDEELTTEADNDVQHFSYQDLMRVDMTDDAVYVWMSDTMIMPLPLHAFKNKSEMEDIYNFLNEKSGSGGSAVITAT